MMPPLELTLAVLALLLTPGPTNSLMLLAGAERGLTRSLRLIPAELSGYFLTVLPLTLIGESLLSGQPQVRAAVSLMAAIWVAVLAVRLWRLPTAGYGEHSASARILLLTTALNPKALIFGLVLLPSPDRLVANLALFAGLVVLVAILWAALGSMAGARGRRQPRGLVVLRRLASVWLGAISIALAVRGVSA